MILCIEVFIFHDTTGMTDRNHSRMFFK